MLMAEGGSTAEPSFETQARPAARSTAPTTEQRNQMMDMPHLSSNGATTRTVALAGATGLVGRAILEGLLADGSVTAVHALGRRKPGIAHPRLTAHVVDFAA